MDTLEAISPIDGRYRKNTEPLAPFFSEKALMRYRIIMEGEYLISLSESGKTKLRKFSQKEKDRIRSIYNLSLEQARIIKDIEIKGYKNIRATDHDLKAIEYYIKDRLEKTSLNDCLEWVHFGLTSEDNDNIALALLISDGIEQIILPKLNEILEEINTLAIKNKSVAMLARTHGQSATPTTFGKEFKIFAKRLQRQTDKIRLHKIGVKLNGATGNWNAHIVAYPNLDWYKFSEKFINKLNNFSSSQPRQNNGTYRRVIQLKPNLLTAQIEPYDSYIELFDTFKLLNTILIGFNQDIWRYISDEWIVQKPVDGAVGSSTMPHKINPIKFENSEGNLGLANAMFEYFGRKMPISRLQRDLSDSTVRRNFCSALAYSLIAYDYFLKGLGRISVNEIKVKEVLMAHPEVIAEAIQTILRREGVKMPYEKLKELTRGKKVTLKDMRDFINSLDISSKIKKELLKISPENYTGLASKLALK
jgi:adenylosuccinate lyase